MCPGVGLEGWLRWSARPSGDVECRGHAQNTPLLQPPQKWQLGFLVSLCLLSRIFPNCARSCTVSLYFVAQGEVCPSASTAAKDPGSQPVSTARNEQLSKQRMWG